MSWTCPGHYKIHVHGRDSPGRPVHGHCPVPLPALPARAPLAWRKKATVRQCITNTHRCSPLILIRIDAVPTILRTPRLFVEINIWWLPIVINSVGYGPWFGASEEIALPLPNTSRLVMWGSHGPFWWYGFGQLLSWRRSWSWEWRVAHTNTPGCSPYSR